MTQTDVVEPLALPSLRDEWPRLADTSRLQAMVDSVAMEVEVAPEMVLTAALGALSVACQAGYVVKMPGRKVEHPVSLMLLTVANSGERKTAVENKVFSSIRSFQKEQEAINQKHIRQHDYALEIWKHKKSALISTLKRAVKEDDEQALETAEQKLDALEMEKPEPPATINLLYEDTTPQALVKAMYDNLPVACVISSEADGILNGFAMQNNTPLNSLWSGSDVTVHRTTRESFTLSEGRLTMALMTQESSVDHYMEKRGKRARGSGLLARFLPVYATSTIGTREGNNNKEDDNDRYLSNFHERISKLLRTTLKSTNGKLSVPTVLTFTPIAQKNWENTYQIIESQCLPGGVYENAFDHASKLLDNIDRIAALIHLCERKDDDDNEIDESTFLFACEIGMRYTLHFLTYFSVPTKIQMDAEKIYNKLFAKLGHSKELFGLSYVSQHTHLTVKEIKQALPLLEKKGSVALYGSNRYQFFPNPNPNDRMGLGGGVARRTQKALDNRHMK
ncbi:MULTISPECIES: YfjI family protein [unclassified Halomonas]|uniref:YfjI family protein n=3 Tax=Halomonas TaxID=2745 RepID=UPI003FB7E456